MDSAFWTEAVKQVPGLAVVAVAMVLIVRWFLRALREVSNDGKGVVSQFLSFMDDRDSRIQKEFAERDKALKYLGDNCHAVQIRLSERSDERADVVAQAMERNTMALGRNTSTLNRVEEVLEDIDRQLPGLTTPRNENHG